MANHIDHSARKRWEDKVKKKQEKDNHMVEVKTVSPEEFQKIIATHPPEDMVATAMTMSLKNQMELMLENNPTQEGQIKVMKHVIGGIDHFKTEFRKVREPLARAQALHNFIDTEIVADKKKLPKDWAMVTCKAGCSNCCHIQVTVNEEEAMLLLADAYEKDIEIDWGRVEAQAAFKGSELAYARLGKANNRCVFLGIDGLCKTYEHRPAACRKYHVANDPADCNAETSKGTMVLAVKSIEFAASGMMDMDHSKVGTMAEMLKQAKSKMPMVHCNYCQKETPTAEQDCTVCGLSKGSRGVVP